MSEKFIQLNIPCKECLVQAICQDKERVEAKTSKHELFEFMLGLRRWDESEKSYRKGLIEAWANMGFDIFQNMATGDDSSVDPKSLPQYMNVLIELANTIQWMINSTSWREGELQDFDKREVQAKIKQAMGWI